MVEATDGNRAKIMLVGLKFRGMTTFMLCTVIDSGSIICQTIILIFVNFLLNMKKEFRYFLFNNTTNI